MPVFKKIDLIIRSDSLYLGSLQQSTAVAIWKLAACLLRCKTKFLETCPWKHTQISWTSFRTLAAAAYAHEPSRWVHDDYQKRYLWLTSPALRKFSDAKPSLKIKNIKIIISCKQCFKSILQKVPFFAQDCGFNYIQKVGYCYSLFFYFWCSIDLQICL